MDTGRSGSEVRGVSCGVPCVGASHIFALCVVRVAWCVPTHNYMRVEVTGTGGTRCIVAACVVGISQLVKTADAAPLLNEAGY